MNAFNSDYYQKVNEYYNQDAARFQQRYGENLLLQRIRRSFRNESLPYTGLKILEIGYGPGLDLVFFARQFPQSQIYGVDVSDEMKEMAQKNVDASGRSNIQLAVGSIEDVSTLFPGIQFDLIYVYFGALNTVEDLGAAAHQLEQLLSKRGHLVLTFINKYFLSLILKNLVQLRFRKAFARLGKVWGGYSPERYLASKCYSYRQIRNTFSRFDITYKRGYSIVFPAWYEHKKFRKKAALLDRLWSIDKTLNNSFMWQYGEYCLYVMQPRENDGLSIQYRG